MADEDIVVSRDECLRVLRRVGFSPDRIAEIRSHLPDPVDIDREENIFLEYGVTRDRLMDLLGGSP